MGQLKVSVERTIAATPATIYGILRDYRHHHPHILPNAFQNFKIEQGGVGAGTIFTVDLKTGGRQRSYQMEVDEPQPGHRLIERDLKSTLVTTFSIMPSGGGSMVRIETSWEGAKGIGGFFERLFAPKVMRKLYTEELDNLDTYAKSDPR